MNKFIILVLALLCASALAFRVKQGGPPPPNGPPPPQGPPREGDEEHAEHDDVLDFECQLPAEDADEEQLDGFMACLVLHDLFEEHDDHDDHEDFEELEGEVEDQCGDFPAEDAEDEEYDEFFTCVFGDVLEFDFHEEGEVHSRFQHRRMQNKTRRS
jgi:hypothetical protein